MQGRDRVLLATRRAEVHLLARPVLVHRGQLQPAARQLGRLAWGSADPAAEEFKSLKPNRGLLENIARQTATLLTYHYARPVSEERVFEAMFRGGDQAKIRTEGFSLLDMKRYLEAGGYSADGYEISLDELAEARVPAIALVRENNYNHFVVVKGIAEARIVVGDPSSGTRILSRADFDAIWQVRILFVIRSHLDSARFNQRADWSYRLPAPIAETFLRDSTATAVLMRPGYSEF